MTGRRSSVLGRGMRSWIPDADNDVSKQKELVNTICAIPLSQITSANPYQPRTEFDKTKLQELANSIATHGVVQPISVRIDLEKKDEYQLITGERRWRAAKIAGLEEIPAYIRVANTQAMLEIALIENIQREDLNPMEVAYTYERLLEECSLKHEELGKRLGRNRTTISNYLRLLKLPPEIQLGLKKRNLSMGHARALINVANVEDQLSIYKVIVEKSLSVRAVEQLVKQLQEPKEKSTATKKGGKKRLPIHFQKIQENLSDHLGSPVTLKRSQRGKGQLVIPFTSDRELERILELINQNE